MDSGFFHFDGLYEDGPDIFFDHLEHGDWEKTLGRIADSTLGEDLASYVKTIIKAHKEGKFDSFFKIPQIIFPSSTIAGLGGVLPIFGITCFVTASALGFISLKKGQARIEAGIEVLKDGQTRIENSLTMGFDLLQCSLQKNNYLLSQVADAVREESSLTRHYLQELFDNNKKEELEKNLDGFYMSYKTFMNALQRGASPSDPSLSCSKIIEDAQNLRSTFRQYYRNLQSTKGVEGIASRFPFLVLDSFFLSVWSDVTSVSNHVLPYADHAPEIIDNITRELYTIIDNPDRYDLLDEKVGDVLKQYVALLNGLRIPLWTQIYKKTTGSTPFIFFKRNNSLQKLENPPHPVALPKSTYIENTLSMKEATPEQIREAVRKQISAINLIKLGGDYGEHE